jgi:hypothetical protein
MRMLQRRLQLPLTPASEGFSNDGRLRHLDSFRGEGVVDSEVATTAD